MAVAGNEWSTMERSLDAAASLSSAAPVVPSPLKKTEDKPVAPTRRINSIANISHHLPEEAKINATSEHLFAEESWNDRIDVLHELEDIASATLAETSFFCK